MTSSFLEDQNRPGWSGRVRFAAGGTAYRPHELLLAGPRSDHQDLYRAATAGVRDALGERATVTERESLTECLRLCVDGEREPDVVALSTALRRSGVSAYPNHVLFADSGGMAYANPVHPEHYLHASGGPGQQSTPFYPNGFTPNPFYPNPLHTPFYPNPFYPNPSQLTMTPLGSPQTGSTLGSDAILRYGLGRCLASPSRREWPRNLQETRPDAVRVAVLDVGLPKQVYLPSEKGWYSGSFPAGDTPDPPTHPAPDENGDGFLDRYAGHGLFVAGRVLQADPESRVEVYPVLFSEGDGDEGTITRCLESLFSAPGQASVDVVNLSFSGYTMGHMHSLAEVISRLQAASTPSGRAIGEGRRDGVVVVASAGNDASTVPPFPANLSGVIGVAALGPNGPAPFTNSGPWVRACASGVDVYSSYFRGWNGDERPQVGGDPDKFQGSAIWSGTSFAAPLVAGRITRIVREERLTPPEAVERLLDGPDLARLPWLGTIVT